jgi:hypothetical protein
VEIPDSVTSIGFWAFDGCTSLANVSYNGTNPLFSSQGLSYKALDATTCAITGQGSCTDREIVIPREIDGYRVTSILTGQINFWVGYISDFDKNITSVVIPDTVTSIGNGAFAGCKSLTNVVIPNSVKSIGSHSFFGCKGLMNVNIPDFVTSIGNGAFYGCTNLAIMVLPTSVTKIGRSVFEDCKRLKNICYTGTKKQWSQISRDVYWNNLSYIRSIECTDGTIKL